jgi:hypothetical protein
MLNRLNRHAKNCDASLASAWQTKLLSFDQLKKSGSITDLEYGRLRAKLVG